MSLASHEGRSDEQLVAALNAGDSSAFDALYYRHRDWVVRLATRFTGSPDDALDVLQETFAYLFRKFPGFVLSAKMTTFLYPVVRNLSIAARKKRTRERGEEQIVDHAAPADPGNDRAELAVVLAGLPEAQREVLLMRFVDGMSLQEIADALSIPEGTVKSRMHNALGALKTDPRVRKYFE
ncbi:MAG: sigW 5 [Phycisphaerales bacterium]|nr:sigW 5 [Phycisphaerales bacterium]MDB5298948.1 sigW 5 [Phycisphaerales bacterium]